jgi:hypothetical protein
MKLSWKNGFANLSKFLMAKNAPLILSKPMPKKAVLINFTRGILKPTSPKFNPIESKTEEVNEHPTATANRK